MTETYYLIPNSAGTAFLGNGYTPDGTLPKGAMVCTQAQASNFEAYAPDMSTTPPSIVSVPTSVLLAAAKTAQSALIKQGYLAALNTPVTFTNAAGVTSTYAFGNTLTAGGSNAQQLLASIVAAGSAAWKAGVWFDTNGVAQIMTFADLQNLAEAVEAQETPDEQDLMSLLAQIAAATTVSAVQAIVW